MAGYVGGAYGRLARRYTAFGPAPRVLFARFTEAPDSDTARGCVALALRLRDGLESDFGLDLEFYSIQYVPCLFHRFCPVVMRAVSDRFADVFASFDSPLRAAGLGRARWEKSRSQALLVHLKARPPSWSLVAKLAVHKRAHVSRKLNLNQFAHADYTVKAAAKCIADVAARAPAQGDAFWDRATALEQRAQHWLYAGSLLVS
ncbi:unnamed protein product [Prorocentrum cordatum]|uniref:DNA-directed DNA polymerase n=1 Tax=Prorocentrum cordatum TaxID=2364126 RepID=A0ABN9RLU0_9DINO|nr:unnamed protein product [Polarella glacialis]